MFDGEERGRFFDLGVEYIDPCEGATISFIQGRALSAPVWSNRTVFEADQAQYRHNQGPCLQAIVVHETIVIDDLAEEQRWPKWREEVLGLEQAIRSRDVIGLAKGILMERNHVGADEAFEMLRRTAKDRNITIRTLAEQVSEAGALPD